MVTKYSFMEHILVVNDLNIMIYLRKTKESLIYMLNSIK